MVGINETGASDCALLCSNMSTLFLAQLLFGRPESYLSLV